MSRKAVEIAFAEVLENNHKQLTLMEENESHKQGRSIKCELPVRSITQQTNN